MFTWLLFLVVASLLTAQGNGDDGDVTGSSDNSDTADPKRTTPPCVCVPYYQCSKGNVITDGSGLLDPRKNTPPTKDIPLDDKYRPPRCNPPSLVCCKAPGTVTEQPYVHACGIRRPNGVDSRIISKGQDGSTEFGEFPWQGAVLTDRDGQAVFKCACVLINADYALTVAHCVETFKRVLPVPIFTRFGVWDTRSQAEPLPYQTARISNIIIHPSFDGNNLKNDIAILKFQTPIQYRPNVDTICLPRYQESHVGEYCIVTGWGKDSWVDGSYSPKLKKVSVPILNNTYCQRLLRGTRLGQFYELDKSFICAGGIKGQDSCKGDGGGPLACYRKDGVYTLSGLVSWGIGCGTDVPAVYVKITEFLDWISRETRLPISTFWPDS